VAIHDFCVRRQYWVVLRWYDMIERGDTLVILRKKATGSPPPLKLIQWYDKQPYDRLMPGLTIPSLSKPLLRGIHA
jgi:hypothetical protein